MEPAWVVMTDMKWTMDNVSFHKMEQVFLTQVAGSSRTILVLNVPLGFILIKIVFVKLLMIFVRHGVMKMEIAFPVIKGILWVKEAVTWMEAVAVEIVQITIYVLNLMILEFVWNVPLEHTLMIMETVCKSIRSAKPGRKKTDPV